MGKKYEPVSNEKRQQLIHYIHNYGLSISMAAQMAEVYYPTAKAINKVYIKEKRTDKKAFRTRNKVTTPNADLAKQAGAWCEKNLSEAQTQLA